MPFRLLSLALVLTILFSACSPNNVNTDTGLDRLFDSVGLKGSFGLLDNGQGSFAVHNLSRFKDSAFVPGGSFHIVSSLIGVKTGRINNEREPVRFDSVTASLTDAFTQGNAGWFAMLAQSIGKDTMQYWLDTLSYGRKNISRLNSFWMDGSISLTADEQLGLVKRLYFDQLPFDKRSMRLLKQVMVKEQNSLYTLSYQLSESTTNGRKGYWLLGWIEENKHPYLFSLQVDAPAGGTELNLPAFLMRLLRQQGLGYGKR